MSVQYNSFVDLHIAPHTVRFIREEFKNCSGQKKIYLHEQAVLHYLLIGEENTDISLTFQSSGVGCTVWVYALFFGKQGGQIQAKIHTQLQDSSTTAQMHLISFLPTQAQISVDGGVTIGPNCLQCSGHLLEENIILGEGVQIKTLPMLDVQSNDVSASHGARIEKLDAKKLFYANSRGLTETEAKGLLVHGYIQQCFGPFLASFPEREDRQEELFAQLMQR